MLAFGWFDLPFGKLSGGVWAQVGPVVVRNYKWELRLQHTRRCCLVVNMTHFQIPAWLGKIVYMGDACVSLYIYYSYCRYTWASWQCLECFKSEPSRAITLPLILLFIFQTFIANIPQIFTTIPKSHWWNIPYAGSCMAPPHGQRETTNCKASAVGRAAFVRASFTRASSCIGRERPEGDVEMCRG